MATRLANASLMTTGKKNLMKISFVISYYLGNHFLASKTTFAEEKAYHSRIFELEKRSKRVLQTYSVNILTNNKPLCADGSCTHIKLRKC